MFELGKAPATPVNFSVTTYECWTAQRLAWRMNTQPGPCSGFFSGSGRRLICCVCSAECKWLQTLAAWKEGRRRPSHRGKKVTPLSAGLIYLHCSRLLPGPNVSLDECIKVQSCICYQRKPRWFDAYPNPSVQTRTVERPDFCFRLGYPAQARDLKS